jgi:hypothetical protein
MESGRRENLNHRLSPVFEIAAPRDFVSMARNDILTLFYISQSFLRIFYQTAGID